MTMTKERLGAIEVEIRRFEEMIGTGLIFYELLSAASNSLRYVEALERIQHAKPDGLDHLLDCSTIERVARIAKDALEVK